MYQIISDGSCDLSQDIVEKYGLEVVPFYVTMDDKKHLKEGKEIGVREFYDFMVENKNIFPKSSMPSVEDYYQSFKKHLDEGKDIICICITTKFSGSFNSANVAKGMCEDEYPDRKITVIDATINTVLQGLLVIEVCKMQEAGKSYDEVVNRIEEIKSTGRIFFTVGSFDYLIHGGRIGKVAGIAASTLGIKPLIVLKDGEIFAFGVSRGRKKSLKKVCEEVVKHFKEDNIDANTYSFVIGYGYDVEEAKDFKKYVEQTLSDELGFEGDILFQQIGATIAVHTGPYPLGISFIEKY